MNKRQQNDRRVQFCKRRGGFCSELPVEAENVMLIGHDLRRLSGGVRSETSRDCARKVRPDLSEALSMHRLTRGIAMVRQGLRSD